MDSSVLAKKMLVWEVKQKELNALTEEIKGAVLENKQTQTVGNVRASFSNGRKNYEYSTAVHRDKITTDQLKPFTKIIPASSVVDFRAACKELNIENIPFIQSDPSVSVKLLERPIPDAHPDTIKTKLETLHEPKKEVK